MSALTGVNAAITGGSLPPNIELALGGVTAGARLGQLGASTTITHGLTFTALPMALSLQGLTGNAGTLQLPLALPILALSGAVPAPARLVLRAPLPQFSLRGVTGATGQLTLRMPAPVLELRSGAGLALQLPLPQLALAAVTGRTATFAPRLALPTLTMAAVTDARASLSLRTPAPRLALTGLTGVGARLGLRAALPVLGLRAVTGAVGQLTLALHAPQLEFHGGMAAVGALAFEALAPQLLMQGYTEGTTASVAATRVTYALQTERLALSRYTNFPFNSFAVFRGRLLGAADSGVFELVGDTDAGAPITSEVRFGITDMNTSRIKRVDRIYIGYRAPRNAQAMIVRVLTNETQQRDYGVPPSISSQLHGARVRLGMGVESRYWQFGVLNRNGEDFTLDTVEIAPVPLGRRLGDKDA